MICRGKAGTAAPHQDTDPSSTGPLISTDWPTTRECYRGPIPTTPSITSRRPSTEAGHKLPRNHTIIITIHRFGEIYATDGISQVVREGQIQDNQQQGIDEDDTMGHTMRSNVAHVCDGSTGSLQRIESHNITELKKDGTPSQFEILQGTGKTTTGQCLYESADQRTGPADRPPPNGRGHSFRLNHRKKTYETLHNKIRTDQGSAGSTRRTIRDGIFVTHDEL
ncbi:uncharacterized protein BT62DRAFT_1003675 [Guyanagaster necrorhizus]|uniref:Uncharacterized protein n=1 Tax=Guyanagaster necrorhizus TaxID=856835 RepID=A0A9P8AUC2_9AGAR|nr:uncharacterized protein BT62DRAFT_1003675 [Guyanagaster necrorhizus MCA 3950]KAG7447891.1 hypothetical protein BT62DRAFT_1003675 [Guyanagaster necrorhizus MCA 3950]